MRTEMTATSAISHACTLPLSDPTDAAKSHSMRPYRPIGMNNKTIRRVVILGGGYAGVMCANRLAGTLRGKVQVTLVNPINSFVERLLLHEVAARADSDSATRHSLTELLNPSVQLVIGSATTIRHDHNEIDGVDSPSGKQWTLQYDDLIYAIGSGAVLDPVPGTREFAFDLSSLEQAHKLRDALAECVAGDSVIVVGGGSTAIEMVSELSVARPDLSLKMITSSVLAPTVSEKARAYIRNAQAMRNVDVIENVSVAEVTPDGIITGSGEHVEGNVVVWAASFAVPSLARDSGLAVDKSGRLLVDASMRSTAHPRILGAGDGAVVTGSAGRTLRMACATAAPQGAHAAQTVIADLKGVEPKPFALRYLVLSLSLGPGDGLIQLTNSDDTPRDFTIKGKTGALFNDLNNRYARVILSWERRRAGSYHWAKPKNHRPENIDA
ncbi:hypothetical protein FFI94_030960 [Rhodococcus sp. KBS0724]|nr:hypothetical protein FFI94_030960 [Rhodococcus sp. KBS0724]